MSDTFCDYGDTESFSCPHCRPAGPVPPTTVERAAAIVKRIERREALTIEKPLIVTDMDFHDWAESVSDRPTNNGTRTEAGTQ